MILELLPAHWRAELGPRLHSLVGSMVSWAGCGLRGFLRSLCAGVGGCGPAQLVAWPEANKLEGGFQTIACQHQYCGRRSSPNGCRLGLHPKGELRLLPASLGESPRSADGPDPGSYPMTSAAQGPGAREIS